MNDQAIEEEIQAKGLNAPRVTPADIESNIVQTHYFTAANGVLGSCIDDSVPMHENAQEPNSSLHLLTFCVLVLRNGHTVTGESHCQDQAKFNAQTGREEARKDAVNKLWPMVVYAERERLSSQ